VNPFSVIGKLKKIAAASIVMGACTTTLLVLHANIIINIVISAAIYFIVLKILKEPLLEEITNLIPQSKTGPQGNNE
jgi:hypothetical protein